MNHRNILVSVLLLFLILIIFSGCQQKTPIVFSEECIAPCWRQIIPGKTSMLNALAIIKNFPDINSNDLHVSDNSSTVFSNIIVFRLTSSEIIRIYAVKNIVVLIGLEPINGTVTVENCIKIFGTPEYAALSTILGAGIPLGVTSAEHILFYGINLQKGISFGGDTYKWFSSKADITPKTKIFVVDFFDPQAIDLLLENYVLVNNTTGFSRDEFVPWRGYGNISKLYYR